MSKIPTVAFLLTLGVLASRSESLAVQPLTDADIASRIERAIQQDPVVGSEAIEVSVSKGIATLTGTADRLAAKDYARAEASKIAGVRGIIDRIVVAASPIPDSEIVQHIKRRIAASSALNGHGISVESVDGNVVFAGELNSVFERDELEMLARSTRGVRHVNATGVAVVQAEYRADNEIEADIASALSRDVYLASYPISVSVESGMVTLRGVVASVYEKNMAERRARPIPNVRGVVSEIVVNPNLERGELDAPVVHSDAALQSAVEDELALDTRLRGQTIEASVARGTVTLRGTVSNPRIAEIAEQDVAAVLGVGGIFNEINVEAQTSEDWLIKREVDASLRSNALLHDTAVVSEVASGTVRLLGEVTTTLQKAHAGMEARATRGVREVVNEILVRPENSVGDIHIAGEIGHNLEFNWRTAPVHNRIHVDVKNGLATLTGVVDTFAERSEAAAVAFGSPGIWRVHNAITVDGYPYPWNEWIDRPSADADSLMFHRLYQDNLTP